MLERDERKLVMSVFISLSDIRSDLSMYANESHLFINLE